MPDLASYYLRSLVDTVHERTRQRRPLVRNVWFWLGIGAAAAAITVLIALQVTLRRVDPILKERLIRTLSEHLDSRVELDQFRVSILDGINVSGSGLRIFPNRQNIASQKEPLIAVGRFDFRADLRGLFVRPMHIGTVYVRNLTITISPKHGEERSGSAQKLGKADFEVGDLVCDDSRLVIESSKPDKDPHVFLLKHIVLHGVGRNLASMYDATLSNAVPPGEIHAVGSFGPWNTEDPGNSNLTGDYTFDHADLNAIHGISGTLHSVGAFEGQLDSINVHGTVEVPNFSIDTANHPLPLTTRYTATVDGMSGDTYLHSIDAKLVESNFTCKGTVVNERGKGHHIEIDLDVPAGRIQDFLSLSVKKSPAPMTAVVRTKAHLQIRPGQERVAEKLALKGQFELQQIHFTAPEIEDKVDMMSLRAQGKAKEAKPGAPDVHSKMTGHFDARDGVMKIDDLDYELPGAAVNLDGQYSLDGKEFNFAGKVRTDAELSKMVSSKWKSILLKPVDPFFKKDGAGAEIPIKITGTGEKPHVGLKLGGH
jgi:hypothetical protein